MATAKEVLAVELRADTSSFEKGTDNAEAAIKSLAAQVDTASEDINASLKAMDDGVSSTLGPSGSMTHSVDGAKAGVKDLAGGFREELPGAMLDFKDGAASAATGLAAAFAPMGIAGTVVAGVLAGFSLMKKSAEDQVAAMKARVDAITSAIEVSVKTTNAEIRKAIIEQGTWEAGLATVGGIDKALGYAKQFGVQVADIVALVNGQQTQGANRLLGILRDQLNTTVETGRGYAVNLATLNGTLNPTLELLELRKRERDAQKQSEESLRQQRDYLVDIKTYTTDLAVQMERTAAATSAVNAGLAAALMDKYAGRE
jgi:hypothetical protein